MMSLFLDHFPDMSELLGRFAPEAERRQTGGSTGEARTAGTNGAGGTGTNEVGGGGDEHRFDGLPSELLESPRSEILELIEGAGGRVWQSELAERSDYSKSTVSRHLSLLEEDDAIERRWIGRQKLVFLPEYVPNAARHPFASYASGAPATDLSSDLGQPSARVEEESTPAGVTGE